MIQTTTIQKILINIHIHRVSQFWSVNGMTSCHLFHYYRMRFRWLECLSAEHDPICRLIPIVMHDDAFHIIWQQHTVMLLRELLPHIHRHTDTLSLLSMKAFWFDIFICDVRWTRRTIIMMRNWRFVSNDHTIAFLPLVPCAMDERLCNAKAKRCEELNENEWDKQRLIHFYSDNNNFILS